MKTPASCFVIALAVGAIILAPARRAQAQDAQEGPFEIEKCQTISKPGSYKLVRNLTFSATTGNCLTITASFVTIDLAGFTIAGTGCPPGNATVTVGIMSSIQSQGIAVRNGSISGFGNGVNLVFSDGSIVEGLRVVGTICPSEVGILATGIVRGNTVVNISGVYTSGVSFGIGISATGTVTGNYVTRSGTAGMSIGQGSTVIGNTVVNNGNAGSDGFAGLTVECPSNVTDNTAVNNTGPAGNLLLQGSGCNNTNNVAP